MRAAKPERMKSEARPRSEKAGRDGASAGVARPDGTEDIGEWSLSSAKAIRRAARGLYRRAARRQPIRRPFCVDTPECPRLTSLPNPTGAPRQREDPHARSNS